MFRLVLLLGSEDERMLSSIKKKINHDVILDFFFAFGHHLVTIVTQYFTTRYLYSTKGREEQAITYWVIWGEQTVTIGII